MNIKKIRKAKSDKPRAVVIDILREIYGFKIFKVESCGADVEMISTKDRTFLDRFLEKDEHFLVEIKGIRMFFAGPPSRCDRFGIPKNQFQKFCDQESMENRKVLYAIAHVENKDVVEETGYAEARGYYFQWVYELATVSLWDQRSIYIPNDCYSLGGEGDMYMNIPVSCFEKIE